MILQGKTKTKFALLFSLCVWIDTENLTEKYFSHAEISLKSNTLVINHPQFKYDCNKRI